MIYNLTDQQSYDSAFIGKWSYYIKSGGSIVFNQELSAQDVTAIEAHFNEMTQAERDAFNLDLARKKEIKAEAQVRIISHVPEATAENFIIKELNLLMLNAELDKVVINGGVLGAQQLGLEATFIDIKDKIKTIRTASKDARTNGDSLEKFKADMDVLGL